MAVGLLTVVILNDEVMVKVLKSPLKNFNFPFHLENSELNNLKFLPALISEL